MALNEIPPANRLYNLVTELLKDQEDGMRPAEVRDTVENAINEWRWGGESLR